MNNSRGNEILNRQSKIMVVLLVLNFIAIGTYSVAVSLPQENQDVYISLNETNTTLNHTEENSAEIQDDSNTDESTDSSNNRNTGPSRNTNSNPNTHGNNNNHDNSNSQTGNDNPNTQEPETGGIE